MMNRNQLLVWALGIPASHRLVADGRFPAHHVTFPLNGKPTVLGGTVKGRDVADGNGTLYGAIATGVGGFLGATGLWLANRLVGKAAVQNAIQSGFSSLVSALQKEREELQEERTHLLKNIAELRLQLDEASLDRENLRGEIRQLKQILESASRPAGKEALVELSKKPADPSAIIELGTK